MEVCNVTPIIINSESDRNVDICNNQFDDSNNYGTSYNRVDSLEDTRMGDSCNEIVNQRNYNFNVNIYRYKFTEDFTGELFKFSKIHQYDERKAFKEAWNIWMEDNDNIVNEEYRRLKELGYDGDIFDKMFKSARYYFRKKSTEKKEPVKRRIYVGSQKNLLEAIDEHIKTNIVSGSDFKPSDGFDEFCKTKCKFIERRNCCVMSSRFN